MLGLNNFLFCLVNYRMSLVQENTFSIQIAINTSPMINFIRQAKNFIFWLKKEAMT